MGFATFSGPVRTGTQRYGSVDNTGLLLLTRSVTIPSSVILTSPTAQTLFNLPAGAKILRFNVEKTVAITGATEVGVVIGKTGGTANFFVTTFNTGVAVGKVAQATIDTALQVAQTDNIGTTDVAVTGTFTATTANATAGSIVVTVEYIQRADSGAQTPTFSQN